MSNSKIDEHVNYCIEPMTTLDGTYHFPPHWRDMFGQRVEPLNPKKDSYSKIEAAIVVLNEFAVPPDVSRWSRQFNWHEDDVRKLIHELPEMLQEDV